MHLFIGIFLRLFYYFLYWARSAESVRVRVSNNQPHSGLFSLELPVLQGDTVDRLALRLARLERGVKGTTHLTFMQCGGF